MLVWSQTFACMSSEREERNRKAKMDGIVGYPSLDSVVLA